MNKAKKSQVWSWVKGAAQAGIAGIVSYLCAQFGLGCTTVNFPSDFTTPTTFNGITNVRAK